ncbi:MAG: hypothetical protein KDC28_17620 [Saprospiraceae bacterium]|nr:hypothetical protein [Saprospiraceae bacterium]MCB9319390.1 hypothetical protein [Lewinellaceae bacterium]
MRTVILLCFAMTMAIGLQAQKGLKFYTSLRFDNQERTISRFNQEDTIRTGTTKTTNIGGFIPAFFMASENGSFLEFAITSLRFQKYDNITLLPGASHIIPGSTSQASFGLRVEYAYPFVSANGIRLYAGAAVNPALSTKSQIPESTYFYDTHTSDFSVALDVVPRIQVDLTDALFIDVNIPVTIINWTQSSIKYESSIVPSAPIKDTGSTTLILPRRVLIRLGVGVRF